MQITVRVLSGFIRQMSEEKLLVPEENIKLISIIGQGLSTEHFPQLYTPVKIREFGVVYRATIKNWKENVHNVVTVKTLKGTNVYIQSCFGLSIIYNAGMFSSLTSHLVEESKIMTKFNHPNVMRLLGVTISQSKSLLLIMPFMAQGSLLSYLRKYRADLTAENEEMDEMVRSWCQ